MSPFRGFMIAAIITGGLALVFLFVSNQKKTTNPAPANVGATPSVTGQKQTVQAAPAFDIVRVSPDGIAVLAGTSEPNVDVFLMMGEETLAKVHASSDGTWSLVLDKPLPVGDVELYLIAELPDGQRIRSKHSVVISIPETRDRLPLVVLGAPGGASKVLQDPDKVPSSGTLTLETLDYDQEGGVIFAGSAKPGTNIRVFSDGQEIGQSRTDENGSWIVTSQVPLSVGVHQLQIDQIEASGRVSAVLSLPFERADLGDLQAYGSKSVVVQPGNSLWRIARRLYGEGVQYTLIYSANTDQIRDPDIIYPGQVLELPSEGN